MLRQELSKTLKRPLGVIIAISAIIVSTTGGFLKVDSTDPNQLAAVISIAKFCQHSAWWFIPLFTILGLLAQYGRTRLGSPDAWDLVQYLLDKYREEMFGKDEETKEQPEFFHRITLYKYVHWRWALVFWPWSEWLVPVARSGSTTKANIPCFRASRNKPDKAEGVAGQTWVRVNSRIPVYGLPDISMKQPDPADVVQYAARTFVSEKWVKKQMQKQKRGPQARALLGSPVETKGKDWGVLVIDTLSPEPIRLKQIFKNSTFQAYTGVLSKVLDKV
jgi:hypothetical protein